MVSAQCSAVSWISTLEVLTWPFLTMRMRSLRVKPITSVDSGQTTSSTQVSPALNTNYMDSVLWSQAHPNISIHLHSRGILVIYIYILFTVYEQRSLCFHLTTSVRTLHQSGHTSSSVKITTLSVCVFMNVRV